MSSDETQTTDTGSPGEPEQGGQDDSEAARTVSILLERQVALLRDAIRAGAKFFTSHR